MARTGPQKIPGASQSYFYGAGQYSGSDMEVNCGVVHTTEGRTLPSYNGGVMAPTVTGVPDIAAKKIRWYQHYDVDESARALANKLGGVSTNTANAFQIELVGTCDDTKSGAWSGTKAGVDYIYWPAAPDWALAEVAWLVRWLHDNHGIPLTCVKDWLAYGKDVRRPGVTPASYGANPARMTFSQWQAFKGWCGHQHVPENGHGDPGSMDFARVIAFAKNGTTPPQEDDVALTAADVKTLAKTDDVFTSPDGENDTKGNKFWSLESYQRYGYLQDRETNRLVKALGVKLDAQNATIDQLVKTVATLAAGVGDLDPAAIVAELRAAIESVTVRLDVSDSP